MPTLIIGDGPVNDPSRTSSSPNADEQPFARPASAVQLASFDDAPEATERARHPASLYLSSDTDAAAAPGVSETGVGYPGTQVDYLMSVLRMQRLTIDAQVHQLQEIGTALDAALEHVDWSLSGSCRTAAHCSVPSRPTAADPKTKHQQQQMLAPVWNVGAADLASNLGKRDASAKMFADYHHYLSHREAHCPPLPQHPQTSTLPHTRQRPPALDHTGDTPPAAPTTSASLLSPLSVPTMRKEHSLPATLPLPLAGKDVTGGLLNSRDVGSSIGKGIIGVTPSTTASSVRYSSPGAIAEQEEAEDVMKPIATNASAASHNLVPQHRVGSKPSVAANNTRVSINSGMCVSDTSSQPASAGGSKNHITEAVITRDVLYDVDGASKEYTAKLVMRLGMRLDVCSINSFVTPQRLERALNRLGSSGLSTSELTSLLCHIAENYGEASKPTIAGGGRASGLIQIAEQYSVVAHVQSLQPGRKKGRPRAEQPSIKKQKSLLGRAFTGLSGWQHEEERECPVPFKHFARVMVLNETANFRESYQRMIASCREILISTDANRLVADLMQVNVDELAAPVQNDRLIRWLEPIVCVVILLNGVSIGYQTNERIASEKQRTWFWIDVCFTLFFFLELVIKFLHRGSRWFCYGKEGCWNIFDTVLVILGVIDDVMVALSLADSSAFSLSIVRVVRLTRLTRLFHVFRIKPMRELALMLKGLTAGLRTLAWAVILLFFCIYIIGIFATITLGTRPPPESEVDFFESVPVAMFTVFRCFVGECQDEYGRPLVVLYANQNGVAFVLSYVASVIFVVFGVFNLIFAIYVEATISAAKRQRSQDRAEEVRVARVARELLKKFATAQSLLDSKSPEAREAYGETKEFQKRLQEEAMAMDGESDNLKISREVFLLTIRDREVQQHLDSLDIGSDMHHLFDIIDADGSGDIEASELIQGLLSVRGEAKKTDVVANLLAVRASQNMLRKLEKDQEDFRAEMNELLQGDAAHVSRNSHDLVPWSTTGTPSQSPV